MCIEALSLKLPAAHRASAYKLHCHGTSRYQGLAARQVGASIVALGQEVRGRHLRTKHTALVELVRPGFVFWRPSRPQKRSSPARRSLVAGQRPLGAQMGKTVSHPYLDTLDHKDVKEWPQNFQKEPEAIMLHAVWVQVRIYGIGLGGRVDLLFWATSREH